MSFHLITGHPVALDSPDHIQPRSTARDNSVNRAFNRKLYALFPGQKIAVLDFGCAGGGMVKSLLDDGHVAIGLEGSDYNLVHQRAEWATIPDHLFTCDVTQPFTLHAGDKQTFQFDAATAWEFLEHIKESDLPGVLDNMRRHLKPGGLVFGSTNDRGSVFQGVEHHLTRKPMGWWTELFKQNDFEQRLDLERHFGMDWVRHVQFNFVFQNGV